MKRRSATSFVNPWLAWGELAWKVGEMSVASAQVISHRTQRIAAAGPAPDARDRAEFTRMGTEKIEAAIESAHAVGAQLTKTNLALGARAFRQIVTGSAALVALSASRTPAQFMSRQVKLGEAMWQSAATAAEIATETARVAKRGVAPLHARATANARRLNKR